MGRNPKLMKAFNKLHLKTRYANEEPANVGKPNGTVLVTGKPNLIWVTTARGATVKAINQGVPATAGYPCVLERNRDSDWVATKGDGQRAVNFVGSGGGVGAVGPHSHRLGFGFDNYVEALRLEEGLVHPTDPVSLSVYIEPFPYTYNNTDEYFAGGTLDLTSNVPATANSWAWVKVGINPVTNTPIAVTGTAQLKSAPLTAAQLKSVAFGGYVPLMGIKVRNAQTTISNIADFISWRLALGVIAASAYVPFQPTGNIEINASNGDFDLAWNGDTVDSVLGIDAGKDTATLRGGQAVAGRNVTAAGAITVITADYVIFVNKTIGAATAVNLPASASCMTFQKFLVKDEKGDAAANNITLTPNGADTIEGAATYVMNVNQQSVTLILNGTNWSIV